VKRLIAAEFPAGKIMTRVYDVLCHDMSRHLLAPIFETRGLPSAAADQFKAASGAAAARHRVEGSAVTRQRVVAAAGCTARCRKTRLPETVVKNAVRHWSTSVSDAPLARRQILKLTCALSAVVAGAALTSCNWADAQNNMGRPTMARRMKLCGFLRGNIHRFTYRGSFLRPG
jgi:hypothetical protein